MSSEQTAALVCQVGEKRLSSISNTKALMERLLCDCGIALAVLLCAATQVRPVSLCCERVNV